MTQSMSETTQIITFPCEEWAAARTPEGELVSVNPVPGTWTLLSGEDRRRFAERQMSVKALFACPRCNQVGMISESFNPPTKLGDTEVLPELFCRKCQFHCNVILKDWDQRKLYCACYDTIINGTTRLVKEYLHAIDEAEATKFFWAQHSLVDVVKLIGIAPSIGFFMQNPKNDRILLTD
jgi:transcription elongation factor Elf1